MSKPDFKQVGDVADKVTWNAAGTRKWRMTYTLLEVKPSWKRQAKSQAAAEEKSSKERPLKNKPKKKARDKNKKDSKPATKKIAKPKFKKSAKAKETQLQLIT